MVVLLTRMQIRCHFSPGETRTGADKQKRRRIKCRAGSQKIRQFQYVRGILQKTISLVKICKRTIARARTLFDLPAMACGAVIVE
jgi:hypothetical protein